MALLPSRLTFLAPKTVQQIGLPFEREDTCQNDPIERRTPAVIKSRAPGTRWAGAQVSSEHDEFGVSRIKDVKVEHTRRPVSTVFMWLGLFTVSWDRFANLNIAGYNLKVCTLAFALAFILTLTDKIKLSGRAGPRQIVVRCAVGMAIVFVLMALFANDRIAALAQITTVILGALVPFFATYWNLRLFGMADAALTALIRGGFFAAFFGLYQLAAFYSGLPQVVNYVATSGGLGRISSFSYEAGYFGYFLTLVIAALYGRSVLRGESVSLSHVGFLIFVLLLANSRATFLALPLLFVLLFARWPKTIHRPKILPFIVSGAFIIAVASLAFPQIATGFLSRAASLLDPTESTSNAPRLAGINVALRIVQDHLFAGIGPGNLVDYLPQYGISVDLAATSNSTIANNIWIQAALDGGLPLLVAELGLIIIAIMTLFRIRTPASRALMAGWITVIVVSSMITSYYFDIKLWTFLAIAAVVASSELSRGGSLLNSDKQTATLAAPHGSWGNGVSAQLKDSSSC